MYWENTFHEIGTNFVIFSNVVLWDKNVEIMRHIVQSRFPSWSLHDSCPRLVDETLAASLCFGEIGPVSMNQMSVEPCWGVSLWPVCTGLVYLGLFLPMAPKSLLWRIQTKERKVDTHKFGSRPVDQERGKVILRTVWRPYCQLV